jgi:hypothetical protein
MIQKEWKEEIVASQQQKKLIIDPLRVCLFLSFKSIQFLCCLYIFMCLIPLRFCSKKTKHFVV